MQYYNASRRITHHGSTAWQYRLLCLRRKLFVLLTCSHRLPQLCQDVEDDHFHFSHFSPIKIAKQGRPNRVISFQTFFLVFWSVFYVFFFSAESVAITVNGSKMFLCQHESIHCFRWPSEKQPMIVQVLTKWHSRQCEFVSLASKTCETWTDAACNAS